MPTVTWARVDPARRAAVVEAAEAEFGAHGFSRGSLNVIARRAGVAKGSLFQYFADKRDLYAFIADIASQRVRSYMEDLIRELDPNRPFFEFLTDLLDGWVAYFAEHPRERALHAAATLEVDTDARISVRSVLHRHYLDVLRPLVRDAHARGDLRADSDTGALMSLLLLIFPHLALAPYMRGLDPILGLDEPTPEPVGALPVHRQRRAGVVLIRLGVAAAGDRLPDDLPRKRAHRPADSDVVVGALAAVPGRIRCRIDQDVSQISIVAHNGTKEAAPATTAADNTAPNQQTPANTRSE